MLGARAGVPHIAASHILEGVMRIVTICSAERYHGAMECAAWGALVAIVNADESQALRQQAMSLGVWPARAAQTR